MVAGLFLAARGAASGRSNSPEALPVPVITVDEGCANFAKYWIEESGINIEPSTIEGLTNCRLSSDGEWFVPTGSKDLRLPDSERMTDTERALSAPTRQALLDQISDLDSDLSKSIKNDLGRIYNPRTQAIVGRANDDVPISRPRSRYTRVTQAFLLDPDHALLADYVAWLMGRKISAFEQLLDACQGDPDVAYLTTACLGVEDNLSVNFPPWIWDLRSDVSLNAYLIHLARTGQLPADLRS
jgi:hypothetical protein